jgi:uncharacterized membrane protein
MFKLSTSRFSILLILFLSLILRLIVINQSLWLDEAIGALVVKERNFIDIAINFPKGDNHPPLYYMLLKIWSNIFGYSEIALRSLSVLFSLGSIFATYKITYLIASRRSQISFYFPIISAILLATSQFFIYYSQEARMYMMAAFFATLSIYSYLKVLKEDISIKHWILFSISIVSFVFTDYMPIFLLPVFWIYALIEKRRVKWWRKFVVSHIPLVLIGIMWLPTFLYQSARGKWLLQTLPAWKNIAGGATTKQAGLVWMKFVLGRISYSDKVLYYSLIFIASTPFVYLFYHSVKKTKNTIIIWLWLIVPLVTGFLASFVFPAFIYFRFVYIYPAFIILLTHGLFQITSSKLKLLLFLTILTINLLVL